MSGVESRPSDNVPKVAHIRRSLAAPRVVGQEFEAPVNVRRGKVSDFSRKRVLPGNWVVPAGSSRSDEGGNKLVEAFDVTVMPGMISEESGRNASELSPTKLWSHSFPN